MSPRDVIAIDGPSASGKSTTAREVAAALGLVHLNSGLLYRTITWIALRDRWSSDEDFADGIAELNVSLVPSPPEFELQVDGSRRCPYAAIDLVEDPHCQTEAAHHRS